jgi:predicted nucleic acid-binding protein
VRITLDTNVLLGGHTDGPGEARQVLVRILRGGHQLVMSQTMFYELEEVLRYPQIKSL